jgi:hypothetical protein
MMDENEVYHYNNLRTGKLLYIDCNQINLKDSQLITRWSQTCSELVPILGTTWEFVASQMLH